MLLRHPRAAARVRRRRRRCEAAELLSGGAQTAAERRARWSARRRARRRSGGAKAQPRRQRSLRARLSTFSPPPRFACPSSAAAHLLRSALTAERASPHHTVVNRPRRPLAPRSARSTNVGSRAPRRSSASLFCGARQAGSWVGACLCLCLCLCLCRLVECKHCDRAAHHARRLAGAHTGRQGSARPMGRDECSTSEFCARR
jgi:hypothetical protein